MKQLLFTGLAAVLLLLPSACVSKRKYNEEVRLRREVEDRNLQYTAEVRAVGKRSDAVRATISDLEAQLADAQATATQRISDLERRLAAQEQTAASRGSAAAAQITQLTAELTAAHAALARIDRAFAERQARIDQLYSNLSGTLTGYAPDEVQLAKTANGPEVRVASRLLFRDGNYQRVRTDGRRLLTAVAYALQKYRAEDLHVRGHAATVYSAQQSAAGTGLYLSDELGWPAGQIIYSAQTLNALPAEAPGGATYELAVPHVSIQLYVPSLRADELR